MRPFIFVAMFDIMLVLFFLLLAVLSFWLPHRQGKRQLATIVTGVLVLLFALTLATEIKYFAPLLLMLVFCIVFISYWALVNLRLKKAGQIVASVFTVLALLPFVSIALEDYLFFKSDAKAFLESNHIVLSDDFSIKSNRITGLTDTHQKFELQISVADKAKIIQQLKNSDYFVGRVTQSYYLPSKIESRITHKVIVDYEIADNVIRETYERLYEGYVSDHDIITISKNDNLLTCERFNE